MTLLRRFVVLAALMFWLGGFTFYVSVVVPVGTEVLGSALRQGFITRQVTVWLNLSGAIGLGVLAGELQLTRDRSGHRLAAWVSWGFMTVCQGVLFWLHGRLDALMQTRGMIVHDPAAFYFPHRIYLWAHTLQWFAGLVFLTLLLAAWRQADRRSALPTTES